MHVCALVHVRVFLDKLAALFLSPGQTHCHANALGITTLVDAVFVGQQSIQVVDVHALQQRPVRPSIAAALLRLSIVSVSPLLSRSICRLRR